MGNEQQADFAIARTIQSAMVPRSLPAVNGLEISSLYFPSGTLRGDLFDVIKFSDNKIAFLIFDVTGHGVSSVLFSAMVRVFFSHHLRESVSPATVLERVNRDIIATVRTSFYLTAFVGYLNLHDYRFTYSSAGHVCPVCYRKKEATLHTLGTRCTVAGAFEDVIYDEHSVQLNSGDWLFLFTDGIYNIYSRDSLEGRKMLEEEFVAMAGSKSPSRFVDLLTARCTTMQKNNPLDDDVAAMALRVESEEKRCDLLKQLGFSQNDPVYLQTIQFFEEMEPAVAVVLSAMDSSGYSDDAIRKMKVSLMELLANAIIHGNRRDFSKKVVMGHVVDYNKVVVSVLDEGEGFDPALVPDPTLPENIVKNGGRGIYICNNYSDTLHYNEKGNRVTFVKYHHASSRG